MTRDVGCVPHGFAIKGMNNQAMMAKNRIHQWTPLNGKLNEPADGSQVEGRGKTSLKTHDFRIINMFELQLKDASAETKAKCSEHSPLFSPCT